MRDFASCFSEYAVQVADTAPCSSRSSTFCISPALIPSVQNAVVCTYRTLLSSDSQVLTTLTWTRTSLCQGLSIAFNEDPSTAVKLTTNSRLFRKLKGSKTLESRNHRIEVTWDLSSARYESGPEPVDGYYILVTVNSEPGLILGGDNSNAHEALLRKLKSSAPGAKSSLLSRQEHFSGKTLYSTRAQFCETGTSHDILISCSDDSVRGPNCPVLSVCIDRKTVIRVKRLQWNFRGNQTIFLDGLLVDLMWDVHDWFYTPGPGNNAVFMFRTRSGMDSRLWLEEKQLVHKDQDKVEFSLVLYACKNMKS